MSAEKTRVLVVDDEPAMRAMAKAMLESMGHETVLANSGEQAVDRYHQSLLSDGDTITMAIMDLTLPGGMSGVEALQELQEMDGELPVVATSGYLEENAYDICQQIGFVGVLPKPYTADKLRHLVDWVVSRRGIPGGYDEGMPRPVAKEEPKEEPEAPAEAPLGKQPAPQLPTSAAVEAPPARAITAPLVQREAPEANSGSLPGNRPDPPAAQDGGNGIADRLGDLVEFAVSHRGEEAAEGSSVRPKTSSFFPES